MLNIPVKINIQDEQLEKVLSFGENFKKEFFAKLDLIGLSLVLFGGLGFITYFANK